MARQANRMMIGVFVVISLIILAVSVAVLGSGKFFKKTQKFVLYFNESIKGLDVGSPVLFEGVPVGSVIDISIVADPVKEQTEIPVVIQVELDRFKVRIEGQLVDPQKDMPRLIEKGLRGVLSMQSLITGKLLIEIDFYPGTPVDLRNINKHYTEVPTIPSTTSKIGRALDKLDLEAVQSKLESALEGIAKLTNNPDLAASIGYLKETLRDARKLVNRVDRQVDPLATDARKTIKDIGTLARNINGRVGGVATSLDKTLLSARGVISEDSPLVVDLQNTLKEISAMSRSIRQLTDYLEQHPETLIRGKKKSGGKQP
ncbi:MAG: MlaD family protein [Thermodesulfobacteriota bacterium]